MYLQEGLKYYGFFPVPLTNSADDFLLTLIKFNKIITDPEYQLGMNNELIQHIEYINNFCKQYLVFINKSSALLDESLTHIGSVIDRFNKVEGNEVSHHIVDNMFMNMKPVLQYIRQLVPYDDTLLQNCLEKIISCLEQTIFLLDRSRINDLFGDFTKKKPNHYQTSEQSNSTCRLL